MKIPFGTWIFAAGCGAILLPVAEAAPKAETAAAAKPAADNGGDIIDPDEFDPSLLTDPNAKPQRKPGAVPLLFQETVEHSDSEAHELGELGVNTYTSPSIRKIFEQLEGLPPIPESAALRDRPEKLPSDRCTLALEMGFLMADGFIVVQCGKMNDIKPIALDLSKYGKAMGVGERMNRHSASLLDNAEKGQLEEFKKNLAVTQADVDAELESLRDSDLAHLIALGGWIRALDAATAALNKKFTPEQALPIFYPDAPDYFSEILAGVAPEMKKKRDINLMRELLDALSKEMTLEEGQKPTPERLAKITEITARLLKTAIGPANGQH